ncbi:MAG TPA: hypothetical protein PK294_14395 [Ignavibacteria bacterium]|nr:hypothetical protein [Ignavibacteria bacterium]HRB01620.1 hypothetical protein [Ignavibacteria bacterium]
MVNKNTAKRFYLFLILIPILFISACDDNINNNNEDLQEYDIDVWDYSDNHYFLDTIYRSSFEDYFNNIGINSQTDSFSVDDNNFQVWIQTDVQTHDSRRAGLHIDLSPMPTVGNYPDSLKSVLNPVQGVSASGLVRLLHSSEYVLNKYAGYISFKIDIPDNIFAGVAYKRLRTGEKFGTNSTDSISSVDTLVLKMIKVQNLKPLNIIAWKMKLRNIYQLPAIGVSQDGFDFEIKYLKNGVYSTVLPINNLNQPLITIMGLDKYTNGRSGAPDGKFDFLSGLTIDTENGWIIFPSLSPFVDKFSTPVNGITIDPIYWYPELYSQNKSDAKTFPNADYYLFSGLFK